jgi:hypothetical protein
MGIGMGDLDLDSDSDNENNSHSSCYWQREIYIANSDVDNS